MNLVVVESQPKQKLSLGFGEDYKIEASYGHIRDLPQKKLGIGIEQDFEPEYTQTVKQKERTQTLNA